MSLTKNDISISIYGQLGIPKKRSGELVISLLEIIKKRLESGEDVLVSGFGKFCVKDKSERRGRNPATKEGILLESRRVVTFRCSQVLREKINSKK